MPGPSPKDDLQATNQKIEVVECGAIGLPTTGTYWGEAADGLVVFGLATTVVKLGTASTNHSISNSKRSTLRVPYK